MLAFVCGLASTVAADPSIRFATAALTPPQHYLAEGLRLQAAGLVVIEYEPLGQITVACGATTNAAPGRVRTGCALLPGVYGNPHPDKCTVIVAARLERWYADSVIRHELAHCGGWPAHHPG